MYIVIKHSKLLRDCLSTTQFDFTSYGLRGRRTLDVARNRSIKSTYIFVMISFLVFICYAACPLVFRDTLIVMRNHDGSTSSYRLNVLNLYLFVSEQAYDAYFNVFYIIETFGSSILFFFVINYYTAVKTLGFTLSSQLRMISTALKSVGHKSFHSPNKRFYNIWVV
ncbi:uncharacterized protein LOC111043137 isoform X1 [Myzus persicae]|uniref:uncharacterized protein LOC111043137 isoform X1 n=1 Tax=Myzus persicae TaxID=13164 RepID=UPI000B9312E1|nr:uncharacterized protein LOC111043137 isoform X1 [Myzus persicae]